VVIEPQARNLLPVMAKLNDLERVTKKTCHLHFFCFGNVSYGAIMSHGPQKNLCDPYQSRINPSYSVLWTIKKPV
jgi:hypothetical protein